MTHPLRLRLRAGAIAVAVAAVTILLTLALPAAATSAPPGCKNRSNTTYQALLACVTLEGVRDTRRRSRGSPTRTRTSSTRDACSRDRGYAESVDYVAGLLEDAGYEVTLDEFEFDVRASRPSSQQLDTGERDYETGAFTGSGSESHRPGDPGGHQPSPASREHERLRGGRLRWPRLDRRAASRSSSEAPASSVTRPITPEAGWAPRQSSSSTRATRPTVRDSSSARLPLPDGHGRTFPSSARASPNGGRSPQSGSTAFVEVRPSRDADGLQRHRREVGNEQRQRRDGRGPPGFRHRGAGHQRQRLRLEPPCSRPR